MTDETVTTVAADAVTDRKAALIAEGASFGLKLDKRYSEERMVEKIAEAKVATLQTARIGGFVAEAEAVVAASKATRMASPTPQHEAKLAAPVAATTPPAQPYSVPPGTTTMADISMPGQAARDEEDRKRLMERCTQLGIAHTIPPRAGPDAIREIMGRHMAENAQKIAAQEAAARVKAKGPATTYVQMRVLPLGHLKISRGIHIPGIGDEMYERGDIIDMLDINIAREHEANGKGEILRA